MLNGCDQVLMFRVAADRVFWVLPGGALEQGDTHEDAARRELSEETGIAGEAVGPCVRVGGSLWEWGDDTFVSPER